MIEDRLNPIVVKELRQGLKSRSFIATFIGLQGAMVLSMFFHLAAADMDPSSLRHLRGIHWGFLGLILILVMPLRSTRALLEEIKGDTMDALLLTRLTTRRIVFGKWMAHGVQILLLVSALLPYLVLRHSIAGVDVVMESVMLVDYVVWSLVLVAVGVSVSVLSSRISRGGLFMLFALVAPVVVIPRSWPIGLSSMFSGTSLGGEYPFFLTTLILTPVCLAYLFEFAASRVGVPDGNHSLYKRLLALGILGAWAGYGLVLSDSPKASLVWAAIPVLFAGIDAVSEPWAPAMERFTEAHLHPRLRLLFGLGWEHGFVFMALLVLVYTCLLGFAGYTYSQATTGGVRMLLVIGLVGMIRAAPHHLRAAG